MIEVGTLVEATVFDRYGNQEMITGKVMSRRRTTPHCVWYVVEGVERPVPNDRIRVVTDTDVRVVIAELMMTNVKLDRESIWLRGVIRKLTENSVTATVWKNKGDDREVTFNRRGVKVTYAGEQALFEVPKIFETIFEIGDLALSADIVDRIKNNLEESNALYAKPTLQDQTEKIGGYRI